MPDEKKRQERQMVTFLFDNIAKAKEKPLFRTGTGVLEVNFGALIHLLSALAREYQEMGKNQEAQKYLDVMSNLIKVKREIDGPVAALDEAAKKSRQSDKTYIATKLNAIEEIIRNSALSDLRGEPQPQELTDDKPSTPQQNAYQLNNMITEAVDKIEGAISTIRNELQNRAGTEPYIRSTTHQTPRQS